MEISDDQLNRVRAQFFESLRIAKSQGLAILPSEISVARHRAKMAGKTAESKPPTKQKLLGQEKLTLNSVRQIRRLYRSGNYTQSELAEKFQISPAMVSNIINRLNYRNC